MDMDIMIDEGQSLQGNRSRLDRMREKVSHDFRVSLTGFRAILAELIGTTLFVFIGSTAVVFNSVFQGNGLAVPFAHAFALLALIHAFGPLSGAHFNPAVTVATLLTRNVALLQGILYLVAQLLGSIIGASLTLLVTLGMTPDRNLGAMALAPQAEQFFLQAFAVEIIMTFFLTTVIFGSAVKAQHIHADSGLDAVTPLFASLHISFAVGAAAMAGGIFTGACLNPARQLGPELLSWAWHRYSWIYYVGPLIGAVLGGLCFEFIMTKPRSSYIRLK